MMQLDILLYGGDGGGDMRPEHVPQHKWFVAAEFQPNANASVRIPAVIQSATRRRAPACCRSDCAD